MFSVSFRIVYVQNIQIYIPYCYDPWLSSFLRIVTVISTQRSNWYAPKPFKPLNRCREDTYLFYLLFLQILATESPSIIHDSDDSSDSEDDFPLSSFSAIRPSVPVRQPNSHPPDSPAGDIASEGEEDQSGVGQLITKAINTIEDVTIVSKFIDQSSS